MTIAAPHTPGGDVHVQLPTQAIQLDFLAIIIPREIKWEKLTTLRDVLLLGGKILDPRFY